MDEKTYILLTMSNSNSTLWKEFANKINGKYIEEFTWHSAKVEVDYKGVKIVFDNYTLWSGKYSKVMTRVCASFSSEENFEFDIYNSNWIGKLQTLLGGQDVKIGREDFDKKYRIKTNNEFKIKNFLQNTEIRMDIQKQEEVHFQLSNQKGIWEGALPDNEFELSYYEDGAIKEIERLSTLLLLFYKMIDRLGEMKVTKIKL